MRLPNLLFIGKNDLASIVTCHKLHLVLLLLILGFVSSCEFFKRDKRLTEGVIEFEITYNDSYPTKFDPSLRPTRMVIKFKQGNTLNKIEGFSGAISFSLIQNHEVNKNITLVKLLNKKLSYEEPIVEGQYPFAYSAMPELNIELSNDSTEFLGLTCYRAIAWFEDKMEDQFEILYTRDLDIKNPNINTPFEEIDGVMLKFSITLYNQNMSVVAQNIRKVRVSDDEFNMPIEYEKVNKETLEDVISLLQ